jgi:hypothetical protein
MSAARSAEAATGVVVVIAAGCGSQPLLLLECSAELSRRVTGTSWRDQRHRARQYRDVWRALAARRVFRVR